MSATPRKATETSGPYEGLDGRDYRWVIDEVGQFIKAVPTPSREALTAFYEADFYASRHKFNDSAKENRDRDREYINWMLTDVVRTFEASVGRLPRTSLDLGCGFGHVLDFLKAEGISTKGYEVSPEAVAHCIRNGHSMDRGIAEDLLGQESESFDLVTVYNVLEHVRDPHAFLDLARRVVNPEGLIYIQVPNDFSPLQQLEQDVSGRSPWWFCPPMHLNYFSADSLNRTLEKNGWNVVRMWSDFPMEIFLLQGQNYLENQEVGAQVHQMRVNFERRLRESGQTEGLMDLYTRLASVGIGRELRVLAGPKV